MFSLCYQIINNHNINFRILNYHDFTTTKINYKATTKKIGLLWRAKTVAISTPFSGVFGFLWWAENCSHMLLEFM